MIVKTFDDYIEQAEEEFNLKSKDLEEKVERLVTLALTKYK